MKLTVLVDNNTYIDQYYLGEPALSYYLEDEGVRLLFDTGYSDVYLRNAKALGIDLGHLDAIICSHAHNDHTGGLPFLPQREVPLPLIAHESLFVPRQENGVNVGSPLTQHQAQERFQLQLTRHPVKVSPHITFLGEIPRVNSFENQTPVGERKTESGWVPDFLPDDSALVYEVPDGFFLIAGCSHAGICNTLEYAKKVTGKQRILGMIGGCHLSPSDTTQIEKTAAYLAAESIPALYPCHCTSFAAQAAIHQKTSIQEVGVGLCLEW